MAKKILLVANTDWYLYNFRLSLVQFLRQKGWQVVLISPAGRFVPAIQREGFRWVEWRLDRRSMNPLRELIALFQLWLVYRREKPDLVHHLTVKPVLYGTLAAVFAGVPGIVNAITGLGYLFLNDQWFTRQVRRVVKGLYRWS
ncbi:MAG: glycosyltransferase, partial [Bellilinea sp.]|nr:glycosyltransferase [Bellilinea sp.]